MNRKTKRDPVHAGIPLRRCAACRKERPKREMIRIACYEGALSVDRSGRAKGRGLYLCTTRECLRLARRKKVLARGFGRAFEKEEIDRIFGEIESICTEMQEADDASGNAQADAAGKS